MLKKILLLLLAGGLVGGSVGYYLWTKKVPSMQGQKPDFEISAEQLFAEFSNDETVATAKYAGKIVAVTGKVRESSKLEDGTPKVILETGNDFGISCEFDPNTKHTRTEFQPGATLIIKGECAGLNFDVQLARCAVVE